MDRDRRRSLLEHQRERDKRLIVADLAKRNHYILGVTEEENVMEDYKREREAATHDSVTRGNIRP
jgi:hypothetical protein